MGLLLLLGHVSLFHRIDFFSDQLHFADLCRDYGIIVSRESIRCDCLRRSKAYFDARIPPSVAAGCQTQRESDQEAH